MGENQLKSVKCKRHGKQNRQESRHERLLGSEELLNMQRMLLADLAKQENAWKGTGSELCSTVPASWEEELSKMKREVVAALMML
jgi:hypothetical protein